LVILSPVDSFNVAEAKARLSEILDRVAQGQEVLLTRRGHPVARIVPAARDVDIIGSGRSDPNINHEALRSDSWWQALTEEEDAQWYE
jgi:prevent-host-death family protein